MPGPTPRVRSRTFAYVVLALIFVVAVTNEARDARDRIDEIRYGSTFVRQPFDIDPTTLRAIELEPSAKADGLRDGDLVLAVNGHPLEGWIDASAAVRHARLGDRLQLRVRSDADAAAGGHVERDLSLALPPFTYFGYTRGDTAAYAYIILLRLVVPIFCLGLGFWVCAVRIDDRAAWLLLVLMLCFANAISDSRTTFGNDDWLQPWLTAFTLTLSACAPVALALFAIAFPEPLAIDRRFPWIKWILFGPFVALFVFRYALMAVQMHHATLVLPLWPIYTRFTWLGWLSPVAIATFFAALGYKTLTESNRDARRRLLLLDAGAAATILPLVVFVFLTVTRGLSWNGCIGVSAAAVMLIFPLTMAYAILVHRAMDVRVVVRQGVQYVLARGGIRVIQLLLIIGVTAVAASVLRSGAGLGRVAVVVVGVAVIVGLAGQFADRLRRWVDRRFFREAYEADVILSDLATKVRTIVETGPLLQTVATRVAESLHVPRIAILLNGNSASGGAFQPAYALGFAATPAITLPAESLTVKQLHEQPRALVQFDDPDSWVQLADEGEQASLRQLQSELLLPLSLNKKLLGIMSLGPKQSEEPFSRTDIRLLDSVAAQTGLALENGRLTAAIAAEVAARAKEKRDLEIAREVQERLFPQEYPPIPGLDYAGTCRPARGVGGDYYDFIQLQDRRLGIAIGDVSGKGIPAALLMATLRAYLRGAQTIHHQPDLTWVMRHLNKLVYESSTSNRYATFFYAEFDPASRVLTYVNGGHNPPMLFRAHGDHANVARLDAGGPVIGLMEDCDYTQGCITLEPGDLLVAFTDGVSEAMNAKDVEWGEEALIKAVGACRRMPAHTLATALIDAADSFVAGAPQSDDMTTVVVRVI